MHMGIKKMNEKKIQFYAHIFHIVRISNDAWSSVHTEHIHNDNFIIILDSALKLFQMKEKIGEEMTEMTREQDAKKCRDAKLLSRGACTLFRAEFDCCDSFK